MIQQRPVPPVENDESLARYVVSKSEFRSSDGTAKPTAFFPYPHLDASVTRHRDATQDEIWQVGQSVAQARGKGRTLYGRADINAVSCRNVNVDVIQAPIFPDNPNHADITGFPSAREDQLAIA